jgi:alkylhydroperoxidase family enzyme
MFRHSFIAVATLLAAMSTIAPAAETPSPAEQAARTKEILGQPPRIAPRTDLTDEERAIAAPPKGFEDAGAVPPVFGILLHNPGLARRFAPMAAQFMVDGQLAPRDRELAILRNAWLMQAPFIWGEHVPLAKRNGILTSAEIEAVMQGSTAASWNANDRAVLKAVEELNANAMISDPTWARLAARMNKAQLVELLVMVGNYKALAYFMNSLRVELRPGNVGLTAR